MTAIQDTAVARGALTEVYDTVLVDLDGVVYVEGRPVPYAAQVLDRAKRGGTKLAFVTNNSIPTPEAVARRLRGFGVPVTESDVVTSAQAAARLAADRIGGATALVIGGETLRMAVREQGMTLVASADAPPSVVIQGFDPDVRWPELAEASIAVSRGVPWIATNPDLTVPTGRGQVPDNGAMVGVISAATGRHPVYAGKPEPALFAEALLRTGARRALMVGDRLDTDVAGATRAGLDSMLVLSGCTSPADLLVAPPHQRPTYVAEDLRGLVTTHPATVATSDGHQCRGWRAIVRDGRLELAGAGPRLDGLRALCAAAWSEPLTADTSVVQGFWHGQAQD